MNRDKPKDDHELPPADNKDNQNGEGENKEPEDESEKEDETKVDESEVVDPNEEGQSVAQALEAADQIVEHRPQIEGNATSGNVLRARNKNVVLNEK